ncbi:Fic family protein [Rhodococcus sp. NBC_00297]|uniref:Fic family protein n=1 Tax=Rhodococcus sp. NBC_00297 TaxID=2976005 RepID=UPI002E2BE8A1|nr:Fic family protein [Rhodococcus sp. NBC_00297]
MRPSEEHPDTFAGLTPDQCHAVDQAVAAERLEGWRPTPADLALLVAECRGETVLPSVREGLVGDGPKRESRWAALRPRHTPYLLPGSTTLRNVLGIVDAAALHRAESILTALRLVRCHTGRADLGGAVGVHRLLSVHRYVFQDFYVWAGDVRTVELSKNGTAFARCSVVWDGLMGVHETILSADWAAADRGELAYLLSRTYADLNQVHPFREGNGRAATMLLHLLVAPTGFRLDLTDVERRDWIAASQDSAPFRQAGAPSARPFLPFFLRALSS